MTRKEFCRAEWHRTRRWFFGGLIAIFVIPFLPYFLEYSWQILLLLDYAPPYFDMDIGMLLPAPLLAMTLLGCRFFHRIEQIREDDYPDIPRERLLAWKLLVLTQQCFWLIAPYIVLLCVLRMTDEIFSDDLLLGCCGIAALIIVCLFSVLIGLAVRNILLAPLVSLLLPVPMLFSVLYASMREPLLWLPIHFVVVVNVLLLAIYLCFCLGCSTRYTRGFRSDIILLSVWTFAEVYAFTINADLTNLIFIWFGG
jgi:hypothetical protein